jgi:rhodanese-related sulfurtransferase
MKKLSKVMLWMAVLPLLFVISCKDDDPAPADDNFSKLSEYLVANDMDLSDMLTDWIKPAPGTVDDLPTFLSTYYIMDIRSLNDYNASHIEGAVHSGLGTIVQDAAQATKPILVVCYTGQSAGHAVVALRLSGYSDARVLKWGMSGWNSTTNKKWADNSGTVNGVYGIDHSNWVSTAAPVNPQVFDNPTFNVSSDDPATMLAERVAAMTASFKGTSSKTIIDNPENYFINNYWSADDNTRLGHIYGAYRIQPMTLELGTFNNLDPSKTIVTYCWTGQTSSMITAYLTVLGYDATSLTYGVNSLIWTDLDISTGGADVSHTYNGVKVELPFAPQ